MKSEIVSLKIIPFLNTHYDKKYQTNPNNLIKLSHLLYQDIYIYIYKERERDF